MNEMNIKQISTQDKIAFGVGDMGNALAMQIIGSYLVFFMTVILGLPGSLSGLIIGISIVWDAITDPVMGYISDHTRLKKFGRRHLYILIGSMGVSWSILCIFMTPINSEPMYKASTLLLFILAYKTFVTILATPYAALGAELVADYHERARLQSIRALFFMVGIALSMVVGMFIFFQPTFAYPIGQLNPRAYQNMALFTAMGTLIFPMITVISTMKYIPKLKQVDIGQEKGNIVDFIKNFKATFQNESYKFLVLTYTFINIAIAFINSLGLHVFTFTFGYTGTQIAIVLGIQVLFSIISQPFWLSRVRKRDKRMAIFESLTMMLFAHLYFFFLIINSEFLQGQIFPFMPYFLVAGFASGALFTIPSSMVADSVDVEELESGERKEGAYFGNLTFFYKLSQSFTVLCIGLLLDLIGFNSTYSIQTVMTRQYLGYSMVIGVGSALFIAGICIRGYSLSKDQLHIIQNKLKNKERAA